MKGKKLSFPFICFFESGLFNGLRPIQIKKSPRSISPIWLNAQRLAQGSVSPLRSRESPDFHERKYTEESPRSQGFVGCNRSAAGEMSNCAKDLEAARRTMAGLWKLPGCRLVGQLAQHNTISWTVSTDRVLGQAERRVELDGAPGSDLSKRSSFDRATALLRPIGSGRLFSNRERGPRPPTRRETKAGHTQQHHCPGRRLGRADWIA